MTHDVPPGWSTRRSADLLEFVTSGSRGWAQYYAPDGARFVRIGNLDHDTITLDLRDVQCVRPPASAEGERTRLREGDILVSITAELGMVGLVPAGLGEAYINQHVALARPRSDGSLDARYLAWFFATAGKRQLLDMRRGMTKAGLGLDDIRNVEVLVPPLNEQRRIVAKLEALQARSRRAREALAAVPPLLEKLRQSILAAAFRGDLTKDWRAKHKDVEPAGELLKRIRVERRRKWEEGELAKMKATRRSPTDERWKAKYKEPDPVDARGLPELPEGWYWASLDELAFIVGGITKGQQRSGIETLRNVPYLRVANVQRGHLDLDEVKSIEATEDEVRELRLVQGDILLNEGGDRDKLGRGWVWEGQLPECIHQNHVFRARLVTNELRPKYVSHYANHVGSTFFVNQGKQTTNLASVSMSRVRRLPVALPPLEEQHVIVALLDKRLSEASRLAVASTGTIEQVGALDRSVLARAFRGELVPGDPNDEPADAMLARLRSTNGTKPKSGTRAPSAPGAGSSVCGAPSPSIHAHELHGVDDDTARAFVDDVFGRSEEWRSALIQYRLTSDFQADWKAEVGHWLKTAERLGYLEKVLARVLKRAKSPPPEVVRPTREANDPHHLVLAQELAATMASHYFVGTGWGFDAWEPISGGDIDVDVSLRAPNGMRVLLQVKAPDQPGYVVGHRLVDGEYDDRVLRQISKGASRLPPSGTDASLIVVSANRDWSLAANPQCVVVDLMGSTIQVGRVVRMPRANLGRFWTSEWKHVAGVVLLDYLRGIDEFKYCCTVLLNPVAEVRVEAEWFSRARVCVLVDSTFRWLRGAPGTAHTLPDGTHVSED